MAIPRTRRVDGISEFTREDQYGRATIPDTRPLLTERRLRRWAKHRQGLYNRAKNGIYDPISMFHLVDALTTVRPDNRFTAGQLAHHLNKHKPQLTWDAVTVGRMLNDLVESCSEANAGREFQPIEAFRTWAGREYLLTSYVQARAVLFNLLDDLSEIGREEMDEQAKGNYRPRTISPLASCPSLMLEVVAAAS